ncbi:MAG: PH domain-containing protein [bacterium]|nr:PH domain-containing protein [bacterium]
MDVFKPYFSNSAYYILGGIIIFISIIFSINMYCIIQEDISMFSTITIGIFYIIIIGSLVFLLLIYTTMSYEFQEKELILKCGPFKSKVQYEKIKKISKIVDLGNSPIGSFRTPKYLLGTNYFSKYGRITTYATSYKKVLLIETDKKRYGITPKDEDNFIRILDEKLKAKGGI